MSFADVLHAAVDREARRIAGAQEAAALDVAIWHAAEYGERGQRPPGITLHAVRGEPTRWWVASDGQ